MITLFQSCKKLVSWYLGYQSSLHFQNSYQKYKIIGKKKKTIIILLTLTEFYSKRAIFGRKQVIMNSSHHRNSKNKWSRHFSVEIPDTRRNLSFCISALFQPVIHILLSPEFLPGNENQGHSRESHTTVVSMV